MMCDISVCGQFSKNQVQVYSFQHLVSIAFVSIARQDLRPSPYFMDGGRRDERNEAAEYYLCSLININDNEEAS